MMTRSGAVCSIASNCAIAFMVVAPEPPARSRAEIVGRAAADTAANVRWKLLSLDLLRETTTRAARAAYRGDGAERSGSRPRGRPDVSRETGAGVPRARVDAGLRLGRAVADRTLDWGKRDGTDAPPWSGTIPTGAGMWRGQAGVPPGLIDRLQSRTWVLRADSTISLADSLTLPNFPAYPSGHACISGAIAEVLGHFIPSERAEMARLAEEAAMSRLYAGVHYRFDNDVGLALGREVARYVIARTAQGAWSGGGGSVVCASRCSTDLTAFH